VKWEDEGVVCRSGVESGVDKRTGGVGERMVFRSGVQDRCEERCKRMEGGGVKKWSGAES